MKAAIPLREKTLGWVAYDGREQEAILWEPGCTYNMEPFYIKNNGNLNLKFKFSVSGIQGDAKLLEAIDFTAMADAGWFKFNTGAVSIETEGEFDLLKDLMSIPCFMAPSTLMSMSLSPVKQSARSLFPAI